ncbi:hypothetical protein DPMN_184370, partial [Dreissena polymorpha]
IIGTNLLTKFHEDLKINVASRVLTRRNAPPPFSHVFQPTSIMFELFQYIIGMNLLTKFHDDRRVNVASRLKNAPPLGSHTNLLTKFHEDWTINVASRVLTRKMPRPWWPYIIGANLLTKFHDDRKNNVTSRVLTRFSYSHIGKNAPPSGGHVFQPTGIIFELVKDIIGMNLLTEVHEDRTIQFNVVSRFHEDWTINVASREKCPALGSHVFQANVTIFKLIQDINKTNLLTIFHENWTINVSSRVLTRKNAPPPGGHVFLTKGHHF